jgi:hypothetical protein
MPIPSSLPNRIRFSWPSPQQRAEATAGPATPWQPAATPAATPKRAVFFWTVALAFCGITLAVVIALIVHVLTTPRHTAETLQAAPATAAVVPAKRTPILSAVALTAKPAAIPSRPAPPPVPVEPPPAPLLAGPAPGGCPVPAGPASAPQNYGTRVSFVASPAEAEQLAGKEQKLVFVLHISGNFEDSHFT